MELKKYKNAITLVELLISIMITSVIMVLLFSIVARKATLVSSYEKGTFYCWKDWYGNLYQKTPTGSIKHVSSCKIKIPKNAKNIKTYVIGGGSSGFIYNTNVILNYLNSKTEYHNDDIKNKSCIKKKVYDGYTYLDSGEDSKNFDLDEKKVKKDYKIEYASIHSEFFDTNVSKDLIGYGVCTAKIYVKGAEKNYIIPKKAEYYSYGKSGFDNCTDDVHDKCYYNGFFAYNKNNKLTILTPTLAPQTVTRELETLTDVITLTNGKYKAPMYGSVDMGTARAGEEYTIAASSIGTGGTKGGNGGNTIFGGAVAEGGVLANKKLTVTIPKDKISTLNDLDTFNPNSLNLTSFDSESQSLHINPELITQQGVEIKSDITVDVKFNPADEDSIIETGFGFFGGSGVNPECSFDYRRIKKFIYKIGGNEFKNGEDGTKKLFKLKKCNTGFTNGMGGAIIIKWD